MLADACLPEAFRDDADFLPTRGLRHGVRYSAHALTSSQIERLAEHLQQAQSQLAAIPDHRLIDAWSKTIETLLDPNSQDRKTLCKPLRLAYGLSPKGFDAGLETLLDGVNRNVAEQLFAEAQPISDTGFAWVVLASNLPALAVQTLLPALALRRPIWFKSPSSEPWFTPFLIERLAEHEPALREAFIATTWTGGDLDLEDLLIERAAKVIAYGDGETIADLRRRTGSKLIAHGPKASLAIFDETVDPKKVAKLVARDIALFDQRGCLSIQALYTSGSAESWAKAMVQALRDIKIQLPPGPIHPEAASRVQQTRAIARMQQLEQPALELINGTVIVEPTIRANSEDGSPPRDSTFEPSPGLRTVRIYPVEDLAVLPQRLEPWRGRIQGAVLAGMKTRKLRKPLRLLGVSRIARPGHLQSVDATWQNGGIPPLEALA